MKKILLLLFLMCSALGFSQPGAGPTAPPARNSWDVFSVFSDAAYTVVPGTRTYNPGWGQAGSGAVIDLGTGDNVWRASNLNYQGLDFGANVNVSAMTTFHVDVWTANETSLQFFQINNGGGERSITLTPLNQNSWNSYDIPLTDWTSQGGFNVNALFQFKIVGSGGKTLYFDNMYFYRAATTPPPTFGPFIVPAQLAGASPFMLTDPNSTNLTGAFTYSSSNTSVATIIGNTVTVVGVGASTITATQAAAGGFGVGTTSATLNVTPGSAPPQPSRNSWDVLSQYGNAYTNQAGVIFDSFGGASIVGDVTLPDGNIAKLYTGHNYSGIRANGAGSLNVSAMTHLHFDVFSPNFTSMRMKLEAANGSNFELNVPGGTSQNTWRSYDIPLSSFTGVDLFNLRWLVPVTGGQNATLYITNVYFYRPATVQPPTIDPLVIPSSLQVGAPNHVIVQPGSNSSGAFTYTSSNTTVATIVNGNEIQVITGGTTVITATQAADGSYGSGSVIATLTVTFPAPGPSPVPPTRPPGDVFSCFTGGDYADPIPAMVRAFWTAGTSLSTIPNGTNTCLQVDNLGYLGYITPGANYNVTGKTKLHVDIYLNTPIANMFIFLLSNGDQLYNTGPLVAGWNPIDITLSTSYPGANLADIYGFKFEHNQGPTRQIYLDNIYFYTPTGTDPGLTNFTLPAKVFGDPDFAITPPTSNSGGAFTYSSGNTSVATIVNGNEIHLVGFGTATITANQAPDGIYDGGSISASLVVAAPPLATAAPTPPVRNNWDVISLYSNAYTNIPSTVWVGISSITDEVIEGNDTKKMSNFLLELLNFAPTNASEMTMLHMDIYTPDAPAFNIWLLNNGDRNAQIFPAVNGWRSIDIPLSTYSNAGLNLNGLIQVKFESLTGSGKTVYVDNVYFYRPATLPPATVGTFTVPEKNVGDANFTITPPTSNNASPWVFTSSNSAIATIVSGDQIQVGTGGTCTITATQVSDGTYGPTLRTASFVVSFPAPGPSPTQPARDPLKVKSVYSAAYATDPGFDMVRAYWTAGATLTTVPNGTDTALRADNLGYIGLIDSSERRLSVSTMTTLHMNIYVDAPFANLFFWLLTDGDQRRDITNLQAGWNTVIIPLSEFAGANLSNVYGFKFEQNQPSPLRFYLDNVYFYDENVTYYQDIDGDTYGNPLVSQLATSPPVGYVTNSDDCDDTNPALNPTNPCAPPTTVVNLRFFVQGYYVGASSMNSVKFNQDGVSSPTDVVDVTVELHSATAPYETLHTATGTLQTDGIVTVSFAGAPSGSFYVAVKGSNIVQTLSATPQTVGAVALSYDFSSAASQAYGDNMIEMEPGVFAFYSGDTDQNGNIDTLDYAQWETDYNEFASGVFATDLDGNGNVDTLDYTIWESNYNNFVSTVSP